jgi:UDP-N-acetylglucosamine:LPS N-acetylglucosamine transferase
MLSERELGTLQDVVSGLVVDPERIRTLESRARALGKADAAARVADLLTPWVRNA